MTNNERPSFRKVRPNNPSASPEELFYSLQGREKSHGYLRGPQQDVLRAYSKISPETSDIAFELPTGTGKTTVGLVTAEWRRRKTQGRVAYLTLTNQLAKQVIQESQRLGIGCADLTGTRNTRDAAQEGLYLSGESVAVTTFSNLFNVNPVIRGPDTLILDDAHGGESFVSAMWTVRISASKNSVTYTNALSSIRPALTASQFRAVTESSAFATVEVCDIRGHDECLTALSHLLDREQEPRIKFPWRLLSNNLRSCLILVSRHAIAIRPLVSPTHTHSEFGEAEQRIYMSATLGGAGDLQRSYGITNIDVIGAEHPQWGRRYVFIPELAMDHEVAVKLVTDTWDSMNERRAVLLAPSRQIANKYFDEFTSNAQHRPERMEAESISDSLGPFTKANNALLTLAGRYDGIDLPDDDCRLLVMTESPVAVGELEQHLRDRWKLGPLLRRRERTRLVQGMGRCTRNATDFAIIFWLGQSLINSSTNRELVGGMPLALRTELSWGRTQSKIGTDSVGQLKEMIVGLLEDGTYRQDADSDMDQLQLRDDFNEPELYDECARSEVRFSRALWSGNLTAAYNESRATLDKLGHASLTGYRSWWWYLASVVAYALSDSDKETDCLIRGVGCGVNSGQFDELLRSKQNRAGSSIESANNVIVESVWNALEELGWAGVRFSKHIDEMKNGLSDTDHHQRFHIGLELLGKSLGATVIRPTKQGDPDVVWCFPGIFTVAFEAKSEKSKDGSISKDDVLQAKGHIDWVRSKIDKSQLTREVFPVIVSPTSSLHEVARPHAENVYYRSTDQIQEFGSSVAAAITALRTNYSGADFSERSNEFSIEIANFNLDPETIRAFLLASPLIQPSSQAGV